MFSLVKIGENVAFRAGGILFLALRWFVQDAPPIPWLFPPIGLLLLVVAASFHHLKAEDQGDVLSVRFGPVPLFRKAVHYPDIMSVEVGQTLLLDGSGIHMSVRGGWVCEVEPVGPRLRGRAFS